MIWQFWQKHKFRGLVLICSFLVFAAYSIHFAQAHYVGIYGYSQIGCGGPSCHFPRPNSNTTVTITTGAQEIVEGGSYIFQIEVKDKNSTLVAAGCDIGLDTSSGALLDTLSTPNSGLYYVPEPVNELTHTMPRSFGGGDSAVWQFVFKAPQKPGPAIIYAAGNAVDGVNVAQAGAWDTTSYLVNVVASNSVNSSIAPAGHIQVFPNPSSGLFSISSQNEYGIAEIKVSDEAGKTVETQNVNIGSNSLDLTSLPNGTYFLHIKTSDGLSFLRRVVIKK